MNSFEQNCKSEEDLIFMNNSLFFEEKVDFNFELNADQILLEVADYESLHTRMFDQEKGSVSDCEMTENQMIFKKRNFDAYQDDNISIKRNIEDLNQLNNTDNILSSRNIEKDKALNTIEDYISNIFILRKAKNNLLTNRRDVINKSILRGFKKFFVGLLDPINKECSDCSKRYKVIPQQTLAERAEILGLMNLKPDEVSHKEFEEIICWLGYPKITKKVRSFFNSENKAINILSDTLSSYSHQKLYRILEIKSLKALIAYFICNGKEQFMNSIGFDEYNSKSLKQSNYSNMEKDVECYEEAFKNIYDRLSSTLN